MADFTSFKLTIYLRTPAALGWPWIALDGLILNALLRSRYGERYYLREVELEESYKLLDGVLDRTGEVYHASVSLFDGDLIKTTTIYKRFDTRHLSLTARGKLRTASGHFRFFALRTPYRVCSEVVFYGKGDVGAVEELMKGVASIGKERNIGFGFVRRVEVEELEEDLSLVRGGRAMRPIPISMLESYSDVALLGYRPPYWLPENVAPCAPPGSKVRLHGG